MLPEPGRLVLSEFVLSEFVLPELERLGPVGMYPRLHLLIITRWAADLPSGHSPIQP